MSKKLPNLPNLPKLPKLPDLPNLPVRTVETKISTGQKAPEAPEAPDLNPKNREVREVREVSPYACRKHGAAIPTRIGEDLPNLPKLPMTPKQFGKLIRDRRLGLGLTLSQVAALAPGISRSSLSRIENGKHNPVADLLNLLAALRGNLWEMHWLPNLEQRRPAPPTRCRPPW